jgi:ubiquinone/menaquinone biosynthesis C-methylase UbiE
MLMKMWRGVARISPRTARTLFRLWYQLFVVIDRGRDVRFMNYGYVDLDPDARPLPLSEEDAPNRYCIQLYHHVAGAVDLTGKDVLEVGSGRGGGASWISRHLGPRSMTGVDFSDKAVAFSNHHYATDILSFRTGDALELPLPDASIDAVVNVESSHCYVSMERFLAEVRRVLRPGGWFLYTDHRPHDHVDAWRAQLAASGLEIVRETDITANVVRALELDSDRKERLIDEKIPRILRHQIEEFAATVGSQAYESFRTRDGIYLSFVLQKPHTS